ncbi:Ubiquinone biosynthesis accessory factor UbiJ [Paraburkholderia caffeinitolerans]|uniref:Ubiquinone biosynthesis accessory factor UbiJ n=1 Tax=Paraburkholderia caffeinitolerans TaxID=1723730 RepID=A0A6J5GX01_9BURK|nr:MULTISPECIES: SCP2 sterol-binding domain-containing protein [Paraburkholderia]CAB3806785.1 Ubiquinone biosynthesis accessory factor UbiJ [Paraburkholderia caffeinitolerans]
MTLAAKPFAAAVNHLLARESWARNRLAPYAGKTARLSCPPVVLTLLVEPEGYLAAVEEHDAQCADVALSLPAGALSSYVQGGQSAVMKHVKIEGDAEFAQIIGKLAEHLRWEPEEDLAKLIGDAPASRVATIARTVHEQALRTGRNVLGSVTEYLLDENPQLVRRAELDGFNAELSRARDALARVEKRIERLEQKSQARGTSNGTQAAPSGTAPRGPSQTTGH